jgi:hypothetical protein
MVPVSKKTTQLLPFRSAVTLSLTEVSHAGI